MIKCDQSGLAVVWLAHTGIRTLGESILNTGVIVTEIHTKWSSPSPIEATLA